MAGNGKVPQTKPGVAMVGGGLLYPQCFFYLRIDCWILS